MKKNEILQKSTLEGRKIKRHKFLSFVFLLCKSLLFFLFFSFSNCQESSLDWEKKMTNTKRDSSSLNILRKSFLSFQIKLGMKGNKKRKELKLLGCCSTWSCFLIHAQCVLFLSNNSIYFAFKMGIEKWHFFWKASIFASLWKMAVGKGFLGVPLFFVGVINVNLSAGQA